MTIAILTPTIISTTTTTMTIATRLPVPTLVTYNRSTYSLEDPIETELDIGPEVTHIYQVL